MAHWPEKRFAYDSDDNVEYRGLNATLGAATSATDWKVFKFYYTSDNIVRITGPVTGTWDARASLGL